MPAPSTDLAITRAVCGLILPLGIVPTTTLTADAQVGDTSVTLADNTPLSQGWLLQFDDTQGEEPVPVGLPTSTTATPLQSPLAYSHASGTTVYANLFDFAPPQTGQMLSSGHPVVFVYVQRQTDQYTQMRVQGPTYRVLIRYERAVSQPGGAPSLNPNVWSRRQQQQGRTDLETIADALRQNPRLAVKGSVYAEDLGRLKSPGPTIEKVWDIIVRDADSHIFVADLTVTVRGLREVITPA